MRCAPWELIDNQIVEQARERAEGVRVAYVAATRARDLLIVPVVGDESGGEALERWTSPLNQALFPRRTDRRKAMMAPACPEFGGITIFNRPLDMESEDEASVQPGMHLPQRGEHTVVWWDPSALTLGVDADPGGMQPEILAAGSSESMDRYKAWSAAREEALLDGRLQKYDVFTPTDGRELPESFDCSIAVEYLPKAKDRPYGPRFGTMVHAILRDVPFDADREEVARIASLHARIAGAQEADTQAAIEAAVAVLGHWLIAAARSAQRCHRELPLTLPLGNRVLEGVIDLAYLDNGAWTIVDFKTDAAAPGRLERYKTQLRWYAYALHKITGNPVRGWLLSA